MANETELPRETTEPSHIHLAQANNSRDHLIAFKKLVSSIQRKLGVNTRSNLQSPQQREPSHS